MTPLARGNPELEGPRQKNEAGKEAASWGQGGLKEREDVREERWITGGWRTRSEALGAVFYGQATGAPQERQYLL